MSDGRRRNGSGRLFVDCGVFGSRFRRYDSLSSYGIRRSVGFGNYVGIVGYRSNFDHHDRLFSEETSFDMAVGALKANPLPAVTYQAVGKLDNSIARLKNCDDFSIERW